MRITVAYASPFRENVGAREETYETEEDSATVKEMLNLIVKAFIHEQVRGHQQ